MIINADFFVEFQRRRIPDPVICFLEWVEKRYELRRLKRTPKDFDPEIELYVRTDLQLPCWYGPIKKDDIPEDILKRFV